jgi:hypothetical protein
MGSGFFMRENATGKIWANFVGNTPEFLPFDSKLQIYGRFKGKIIPYFSHAVL